jgi:N-acetylglutamate synthase-like GNAT family acetyltransferase
VDRVYVTTDRADYFRNLGFVEMADRSKEYMDALALVCRTAEKNKILMSRGKE